MTVCYLGLGSNLGDRRKNIKKAMNLIKALKGTKVEKLSKLIKTQAIGGPKGQPKFLNAVAKIQTQLAPLELLKSLKKIEEGLGRIKTVRYGPRIVDLDILFYAGKIVNRRNLKIPHPKAFKREFVLRPLLQIL